MTNLRARVGGWLCDHILHAWRATNRFNQNESRMYVCRRCEEVDFK